MPASVVAGLKPFASLDEFARSIFDKGSFMDRYQPIFSEVNSADDRLAREIEAVLGIDLPATCVQGVALNARLLQAHADILRRVSR